MINKGEYVTAYELLTELDGYKDSIAVKNSISKEYANEKFASVKVGDYVTFGSYEQDNNIENGKEGIEWLILDKKADKILLISKYAIAAKMYHIGYDNVTWETCTLRKWLNEEFINMAFTKTEQEMITTVTVSADKNTKYDIDSGKSTKDKIFLLSVDESNKYFASNADRKCEASEYAKGQGGYVYNNGSCWWLRSPSNRQNVFAFVDSNGVVDLDGRNVNAKNYVARPAMWVEFE